MITLIALFLRGWWWIYYAAWNAGEWIVTHPAWLTQHTFQVILLVNAPLLLNFLIGYEPVTPSPGEPPFVSLLQSLNNTLPPIIFSIDKFVISGLILAWLAHLSIEIIASLRHKE